MIYPKELQCFRNILLACSLVFLFYYRSASQNDTRYFLSGGIKIGSAAALGSTSKRSTKTNDFGKYRYAFNTEVLAELVLKNKYSLCIGYRYLDYALKPGDAALDPIKEKFGKNYDDYFTEEEYGLMGGLFSFGASRIFQYKRIRLQTKLELGVGKMEYDFITLQGLSIGKNYKYSCDQSTVVLTLIPEINLQYIFKRTKYIEFAGMLGADLIRVNPEFNIIEHTDINGGPKDNPVIFSTLHDPVTMLNINLGFCIHLKRKIS